MKPDGLLVLEDLQRGVVQALALIQVQGMGIQCLLLAGDAHVGHHW